MAEATGLEAPNDSPPSGLQPLPLTRGKQLVLLVVVQKKALAMAIKNHRGRRRYTKPAEGLALEAATADCNGRETISGI